MAAVLDQSQRDSLAGGPVVESISITPPQSANGKKDAPEGVPSELSDLELDRGSAPAPDTIKVKQEEIEEGVEQAEEIEPDHYYGGGKVPVFKPVSTMHILRCSTAWSGDSAHCVRLSSKTSTLYRVRLTGVFP